VFYIEESKSDESEIAEIPDTSLLQSSTCPPKLEEQRGTKVGRFVFQDTSPVLVEHWGTDKPWGTDRKLATGRGR
jgi:hypothetical protein